VGPVYQLPIYYTDNNIQLDWLGPGIVGQDNKIYVPRNGANILYQITDYSAIGAGFPRVDSIYLEQNIGTVAFFPTIRYRVGPIDDLTCDTLGINNNPLAAWNYTQYDTIQHIVQFWDLTDYEPTYWFWDFGDGDTSTIQNPQHQYDKGGAYWVCLIVGNANSADTLCKWVYLPLGTSSNDVNLDWPVSVYPNPTQGDQVQVVIPAWAVGGCRFDLYDMLGRQVVSSAVEPGRNAVALAGVAAVHYAYTIRDERGVVRASGFLEVLR
jgi:PKD domain